MFDLSSFVCKIDRAFLFPLTFDVFFFFFVFFCAVQKLETFITIFSSLIFKVASTYASSSCY